MILRRFTDYHPEPANAGWTQAVVREAATPLGPWVDAANIATLAYSAGGAYSTDAALLEDGWYQLVFRTADGDEQATEPIQAPPLWTPSVQDVARVSQGYTRAPVEMGGLVQGTFDATTNPTADEVRGYIATATDEVRSRAGVSIPAHLYELAGTVAMWHAAATVEAEHGGAGTDADSSFRWKQSSYVATLNELLNQARRGALRLS